MPNNAVKNLRQGQNIGGVGYIVYSRIGPKADSMLGHAFCSAEERIAPRADCMWSCGAIEHW